MTPSTLLQRLARWRRGSEPVPIRLVRDSAGKTACMGLAWRQIGSSGARGAAQKLARSAKASHWHYIPRTQTVGFGRVPRGQIVPGSAVYPAAVLASARATHGVFCLGLAEGVYWIAVLHDGRPTGVDQVLLASPAQVSVRLREVVAQHGARQLFTDLTLGALEGCECIAFSVEELLGQPVEVTQQLRALSDSRWQWRSLPRFVVWVPLGLAGVLLAREGSQWWSDRRRAEALAEEQARWEQDKPGLLWERAIDRWIQQIPATSVPGVNALRQQLDQLPVQWLGWVLESVQCRATDQVPEKTGGEVETCWRCDAAYRRGKDAAPATNARLARSVPSGFTLSLDPVGRARLSWQSAQHSAPLTLAQLPPLSVHRIETASALQALLPAFKSDPDFSFKPVEIVPPRSARDNAVVPRPSPLSLPAVADLVIDAPLRSFDAMLAEGVNAHWTQFSLQHTPLSDAAGGIQRSALHVIAKGRLYGTEP